MASTVYYGKSESAADVQAKVVKLQLTQEELSRLQEELSQDGTVVEENLLFNSGDELVVHFAHANEVDYPSLVLSIGDSNEEISISTDNGKSIHSNSPTPAVAGCWDSGEVVTFVYTVSETLVGAAASNEAYWVMDDGGIADRDTYGVTKLVDTEIDDTGKDDNSAITLGGVKYLLNNMQGNTLSYAPKVNSGIELGTLTLDGDWFDPQSVTLFAPEQSALPANRDLSLYDNTNSQFITSAPLSGYVPTSRKVNGKALTGDINLTYSDVGAASSSALSSLSNALSNNYYTISNVDNLFLKQASADSTYLKKGALFKVVRIKTRNITFSAMTNNTIVRGPIQQTTEAAKRPTDGKYVSVNTSLNLMTITLDGVTGYTPVGIIGYNVQEGDISNTSTYKGGRAPGDIIIWSIALRGGTVTIQASSLHKSEENKVYIIIDILYALNGLVS